MRLQKMLTQNLGIPKCMVITGTFNLLTGTLIQLGTPSIGKITNNGKLMVLNVC